MRYHADMQQGIGAHTRTHTQARDAGKDNTQSPKLASDKND